MNTPSTQRQIEAVVWWPRGSRGFDEGVQIARDLDEIGRRIGWGGMADMAELLRRMRAGYEPVETIERERENFLRQLLA